MINISTLLSFHNMQSCNQVFNILIDLKCGNPVFKSHSHAPRITGGVPVDPVGAHPWLHSIRKYLWSVSKIGF